MIEARQVARILGGESILGRRVRSAAELESAVLRGLPRRALESCIARAVARRQDRSRALYRFVPKATFNRAARLSRVHSERTERLARLIATAEHVWGDRGDAREWLTTPHPELQDRAPLEAAVSELGARRAEEVLWKGAYGLPA